MERNIYITHYIDQDASPEGWGEIPFITKTVDGNGGHFYMGLEFNDPLPADFIEENEVANYFIKVTPAPKATTEDSVWKTPTGDVYIVNADEPFEGRQILLHQEIHHPMCKSARCSSCCLASIWRACWRTLGWAFLDHKAAEAAL